MNVALYGRGGKRWALTERGRRGLDRDASSLAIGPSALHWDGRSLHVELDEVTVPLPSRIRGRVTLHPETWIDERFALDDERRHGWQPLAPCSRVEVELERPSLRWSGRAYLDTNGGTQPLETAFQSWHWSRSPLADGATAILYDVRRRSGEPLSLALRIDPDGAIESFEPPPEAGLPRTFWWRIDRATRSEPVAGARVEETLEDTPFYARSLVAGGLLGETVTAVHESLSLDRFRQGWVQLLLPFRMPRRRS